MRDKIILWLLSCIPKTLASHVCFLLRNNHALPDRWGYHVRPIHYYEPLPDFREISETKFNKRKPSNAINFNLPKQLECLGKLALQYSSEIDALNLGADGEVFDFKNEYFSGMDAAVYYAIIRDAKPKRVVEIGSGFSTRIAAAALKKNRAEGQIAGLTCIEPYPEARLTSADLEITLIQEQAQEVPIVFFESLQAGDILFIDSSHVAKFGSDVCYEFLQILPVLKPGVLIHVHDIFFPRDYPSQWLIEKRIAFNEQYLLEAFLAFNTDFEVVLANNWLCLEHMDIVHTLCSPVILPDAPQGRGSFWMKRREGV